MCPSLVIANFLSFFLFGKYWLWLHLWRINCCLHSTEMNETEKKKKLFIFQSNCFHPLVFWTSGFIVVIYCYHSPKLFRIIITQKKRNFYVKRLAQKRKTFCQNRYKRNRKVSIFAFATESRGIHYQTSFTKLMHQNV